MSLQVGAAKVPLIAYISSSGQYIISYRNTSINKIEDVG